MNESDEEVCEGLGIRIFTPQEYFLYYELGFEDG
jgi:hypothetical protein